MTKMIPRNGIGLSQIDCSYIPKMDTGARAAVSRSITTGGGVLIHNNGHCSFV